MSQFLGKQIVLVSIQLASIRWERIIRNHLHILPLHVYLKYLKKSRQIRAGVQLMFQQGAMDGPSEYPDLKSSPKDIYLLE